MKHGKFQVNHKNSNKKLKSFMWTDMFPNDFRKN